MKIRQSKNGRWLQLHGVKGEDTWAHELLNQFGFRFERRGRHWWGANVPANLVFLQRICAEHRKRNAEKFNLKLEG